MFRPHVVSPAEIPALGDLALVARTTVEGLRQGLHRSPFHGYSAEFSQYRHYRPGDDLKYVDWKAFARTDRLYTRQFRETTNLSALFVLDVSRSMDFEAKFTLARTIAAVLGTLVLDQGDAAGWLAAGDRPSYVPPRSGRHHLRTYLSRLARLAPVDGEVSHAPPAGDAPAPAGSVAAGLARAAALLSRRGLVIALSDFSDDERALGEVRRLSRMGHDVIVIQTLAAGEIDLDVPGVAELVDSETGRRLVILPDESREAYGERFESWRRGLCAAVAREGLDYLCVSTADPLERVLRRFLIARRRSA
jgi:uncharacterized protein (DUF58 family)